MICTSNSNLPGSWASLGSTKVALQLLVCCDLGQEWHCGLGLGTALIPESRECALGGRIQAQESGKSRVYG